MFIVVIGGRAQAKSILTEKYLWRDFRLAHQTMLQEAGQMFTGSLLYTPSFQLRRRIRAGFDLGASMARIGQNPLFVDLEYGVRASFWFTNQVGFEATVGLQNWLGNGGHSPYLGGGVIVRRDRQLFRFFQSVFVNYAYIKSSPRPAHQIRIGLGITP